MNARINPDRPLTDAEKARRHRDNHAAYVRALERALLDARDRNKRDWQLVHAETIHRAQQAQRQG
jgi:hypothetical protein